MPRNKTAPKVTIIVAVAVMYVFGFSLKQETKMLMQIVNLQVDEATTKRIADAYFEYVGKEPLSLNPQERKGLLLAAYQNYDFAPIAQREIASAQAIEVLSSASKTQWLSRLKISLKNPKPWQFLTYAFMHTSLNHLLYNLMFFLVFGAFIERRMPRSDYILILISGTVFSGIGSYFEPQRGYAVNVAGLSGTVYCLQGIWLSWFFYSVVESGPKHVLNKAGQSKTEAVLFLLSVYFVFYLVLMLFGLSLSKNMYVSNGAHVAGLYWGFFWGLFTPQMTPEEQSKTV